MVNLFGWLYLMCRWLLLCEDSITQELAERLFASVERINSRNRVKLECENDVHQDITGRLAFPVAQIGHVTIGHTNASSNLFIRQSGHEASIVEG